MLLRNTMPLLLVAWQVVAWAAALHDTATRHDTRHDTRRAHMRRRMLERLAERGLDVAEAERQAEELLARIFHTSSTSSTTTELPYTRHTRHNRPPFRPHSSSHTSSHSSSHSSHSSQSTLSASVAEAAFRLAQPQVELLLTRDEAREPTSGLLKNALRLADMVEEEPVMEVVGDMEPAMELVGDMEPAIEDVLGEVESTRNVMLNDESRPRLRENRREMKTEREKKRKDKKEKRGKKKVGRNQRQLQEFMDDNIDDLYKNSKNETVLDCCPSTLRLKEKRVGEGQVGQLLEIDPNHQMLFYERVCKDVGKPCLFPPRSVKKSVDMRCVQQTSYSQAIARPYGSNQEFKVDFVKVRSGCSCEVVVQKKKKRKRKR